MNSHTIVVLEIAAKPGGCQAHFSRWLRRCFGVTPGNYMAARQRVKKTA
ncbi:hypothetical protein [Variovorax sp. Root411]|nr:hypothetical protein [Variovorax sp. Root411]